MNFRKKNGILFVAPVRFLYRRDAEETRKGQIYMNKSVFIAEKPSVAQEFAKALKVKTTRHDGYLESENTIVTWCVGHLVTMSYPEAYDIKYKRWTLETLPFLPGEFKYEVIPSVKKQFEIVRGLLNRPDVDTIYVCTDSGREGEYIYRLVAQMAGVRGKKEKRVWIDSQTEEEIIRGIKEAKDLSAYDNLSASAYLRAKEDYLMGINFSRILTLRYGNSVSNYLGNKYQVISVGRVMTCVLGMVVRREREIREFVKTPFYRVLGKFLLEGRTFDGEWRAVEGSRYFQSPDLYKENGFKDRNRAEELKGILERESAVSVTNELSGSNGMAQQTAPVHQAVLEKIEKKKEKKSSQETVKEMSANTGDKELKELHDIDKLDSGVAVCGILEVMPDGYGFIRSANYLPGENDIYVSPSQIRRFNLKTGDILEGNTRIKTQQEKFSALLYLTKINDIDPLVAMKRKNFEDLTPIFPDERLRLECGRTSTAMRIVDLLSPIGKGQRGMIVSPPKAGKTTLLKQVAQSVRKNNPEIHLLILLIDERPEEVTDIKESIEGDNVEVIYSTFDELPEHHKRVSEMVIERAKRLVEHKKDVMILLDSITRLARAYNLTVPPSGRTLSGGLDPAALHMPKRFFGAARNMRGGGSLTILATALVDTGSKMDDVIYEEFKGTGNMELVLDRKLSERRVFPAIDIPKSGTRREDLLLTKEEQGAVDSMRRALNGMRPEEAADNILNMFSRTRNNEELMQLVKKTKLI